jgi:type I restriction enzyme S subunit
MSNYINELRNSTQGSTIQYLKKNQFTDAKISLPSLPEQKRIVDLISSMDNGISATEKLISDTKQLRSGLLSDLLSGEHEIPQSYDKVMGAA